MRRQTAIAVAPAGRSAAGARRRMHSDRRVFVVGLGLSIAAHLVVLIVLRAASGSLEIAPHAQLRTLEPALLTAVHLPPPTPAPPPRVAVVPQNDVPVPAAVDPDVPDVEIAPITPPDAALVGPAPLPSTPPAQLEPMTSRALAADAGSDKYEQEVARWVERHRDYPLAARQRGLEGTAIVKLRLAANGTLLQAQIVRDTGHAMLDRAAVAMVERASPFPEVPSVLRGSAVEVLVPIQFSLGR